MIFEQVKKNVSSKYTKVSQTETAARYSLTAIRVTLTSKHLHTRVHSKCIAKQYTSFYMNAAPQEKQQDNNGQQCYFTEDYNYRWH